MATPDLLKFINPATGTDFGSMPSTSAGEIETKVADMRHAFKTWSKKSVGERVWILSRFKEYLVDRSDAIATVLNQACGKTMQDSLLELFITVDNLSQMTRNGQRWLTRQRVPRGLYVFKNYYVDPTPYGVVAVLGPWNYPFVQVMTPVLAALLAGNTVVIKPSEEVAAVGLLLEDLFAGFPEIAPYVRVVHGDGRVGSALVNAKPDLIFLTGSTGTAQKIMRSTIEEMTPMITELGGKDAMIICEDADIEAAAEWGVWGANYHSGQVCMSVERIYVVESAYDRFVAAVEKEIQNFKLGYSPDKLSPYHSGPMTTQRQADLVKSHITDAVAQGATLLYGGTMKDLYIDPTVLTDVSHDMLVMREETFGPVMPIMKVKDEYEAIERVNDSEYGLCAYIWSRNHQHAVEIGKQLDVGTVVVNDAMAHYAVSNLPFGGVKKSGNGRIHGRQEVMQFTRPKGYAVGMAPQPFDVATRFRRPGHYNEIKRLMKFVFGSGRQKVEAVFPTPEGAPLDEPPITPELNQVIRYSSIVGSAAVGGLAVFGLVRWLARRFGRA